MTNTTDMSFDRQQAIRLMQHCGWTHKRAHFHEFRRPDGSGLLDLVRVSHGNLSLEWAITKCGDEELARRITQVRREWVKEAFAEMGEAK